MAVPVYANSGAVAVTNGGANIAMPYPSGIGAGDLLLATYGQGNRNELPTLPAGFTLASALPSDGSLTWVAYKFASGSESGSLTIVQPVSSIKMGRMHRFTGADSVQGIGSVTSNGKIITHADIIASGPNRLGLALTVINDNESASSFTGETGGDLTLLLEDLSALGSDIAISLQTSTIGTGTLSGGSWSFGGASEDWGTITLAIFDSVADPDPEPPEFTPRFSGLILPGHF